MSTTLGAAFTITPGTREHFAHLAHAHYRAGSPATFAQVLCAFAHRALIGVLVISHAPLNAAWRTQAWPDLFPTDPAPTPSAHSAATIINARIRRLSRIIVHPRYRARGVATSLVRHYLANPLTSHTEAITSLAAGFFSRAGMRALPPRLATRDRHFADALHSLGIPPWRLSDLQYAHDLLARTPAFTKAVTQWAAASRHSRAACADPHALPHAALFAASRILAPPRIFAAP